MKSIALGVLLMLSPTAKAAGVDQVLVAYFNKLYIGASPKCTVDQAVKTRILAEIEPKCLIRTVKDEGSYISGVKSACSEASVKAAVDTQLNLLCENSAFKADQAAILKQNQANATAQQQQAANGGKQASGGGVMNPAAAAKAAQSAYEAYRSVDKANVAGKAKDKISVGDEKKSASSASTDPKSSSGSSGGSGSQTMGPANKPADNSGWSAKPASPDDKSAGSKPEQKPEQKVDPKDNPIASGNTQPGDSEAAKAREQPKIDEAKRNLANTEAGKPAEATDSPVKPETDPILEARHKKSTAEDTALMIKLNAIKAKIRAGAGAIPAEVTAKTSAEMGTGPATAEAMANLPQALVQCLNTQIEQIEKDVSELKTAKESCSNAAAQAEKLCSMVRSEKAQTVQQLMSVGATVLSKVTAASEACGTTSDLSKVAQGGMLLAQGACTAMKYRCDISCNAAKKTLEAMKVKIAAMEACPKAPNSAQTSSQQVDVAVKEFKIEIEQELAPVKSVPSAIAQCQQHKADIALMGVAALGFLSSFQDAQDCKKQLAAGGENKNGTSTSSLAGPNMTTAEYCSMPSNATSLTCKCTTDPNADGCIGSLAKSGVNIGKIGNNGGASAFASAVQNGLGSLESLSKSPLDSEELPPGANLSEAAREALGIGGTAAGAAGGGSGLGSNSADVAKKGKAEEKETPKFGFFSSLGNMLSGGKKPDQAANATIRKYEQDQAIKRKLASDQVRAEISTASGKSNFDKIRSRYQQNATSFEQ